MADKTDTMLQQVLDRVKSLPFAFAYGFYSLVSKVMHPMIATLAVAYIAFKVGESLFLIGSPDVRWDPALLMAVCVTILFSMSVVHGILRIDIKDPAMIRDFKTWYFLHGALSDLFKMLFMFVTVYYLGLLTDLAPPIDENIGSRLDWSCAYIGLILWLTTLLLSGFPKCFRLYDSANALDLFFRLRCVAIAFGGVAAVFAERFPLFYVIGLGILVGLYVILFTVHLASNLGALNEAQGPPS